MSAPATASAATRALEQLVALLVDAGLEATRDAGSFYPQPLGILVGLPTLARRTHAGRTFTVPVLIVSGDPFNSPARVDGALELADEVALVLRTDNYRPSSYRSSVNAEPLPAIELSVTVTVPEEEAP